MGGPNFPLSAKVGLACRACWSSGFSLRRLTWGTVDVFVVWPVPLKTNSAVQAHVRRLKPELQHAPNMWQASLRQQLAHEVTFGKSDLLPRCRDSFVVLERIIGHRHRMVEVRSGRGPFVQMNMSPS